MDRPAPQIHSLPYGPHPRNELDFWRAKGDAPAPLLVWIHGGGFTEGDKRGVPAELLCGALEAGMHVASINYRLSQQAPFPAPFEDAARAIQYLRYRAGSWGIDPARVAAAGGSAGAGISMWLGYGPDRAEPGSDDAVARQSTRLQAIVSFNGQSSYDPNFIRENIAGPAWRSGALQLLFRARPEEYDQPRLREVFASASPIRFVSPGAPPTCLLYDRPNTPPGQEVNESHGIHHPRFGELLCERLRAVGTECMQRGREDRPDWGTEPFWQVFSREALTFLERHLQPRS